VGRHEDHRLAKRLYVGNLPFSATESELRRLFEPHGEIASVNIITDRETGRARGFAFVEMEDPGSADAAMRALDGRDMGGRPLRVNEAQDKRSGGGGGGGGFGGGGGGGGYGRGRDRY
jgi:RNA recognition motif-containing protein